MVIVSAASLSRLYFGLSGRDETEIRAFFARQLEAFPQALLAELPGIPASASADYATACTVTELECCLTEPVDFQPFRQHDSPPIKSRQNEQRSMNL